MSMIRLSSTSTALAASSAATGRLLKTEFSLPKPKVSAATLSKLIPTTSLSIFPENSVINETISSKLSPCEASNSIEPISLIICAAPLSKNCSKASLVILLALSTPASTKSSTALNSSSNSSSKSSRNSCN